MARLSVEEVLELLKIDDDEVKKLFCPGSDNELVADSQGLLQHPKFGG